MPRPSARRVRLWLAALVVILILVVLAAGLTALGYGPLASAVQVSADFRHARGRIDGRGVA